MLEFRSPRIIICGAMFVQRPLGITILAILLYLNAVSCFFVTLSCLFGQNGMIRVLSVAEHFSRPEFPNSASWTPLMTGVTSFAGGLLFALFARGLWKLKNWARLWCLIFAVADTLAPSAPFVFGVLKLVIPRDPITTLLGAILSFALVLYLISTPVRTAFGVTETRSRWLIAALTLLAVLFLTYNVAKSGPEIQAIRWHMRHGNRVSVNGVSFPVYYWQLPCQRYDGTNFDIQDIPGPLRNDDSYMAMRVEGEKEAGSALTVEQLVDRQVQSYQHSGYKDTRKLQLQVAQQSLSCVQNRFWGNRVDCYGDGPIASIFFVGGDRSLERFKRMMADARLDRPK